MKVISSSDLAIAVITTYNILNVVVISSYSLVICHCCHYYLQHCEYQQLQLGDLATVVITTHNNVNVVVISGYS